MHCVPETCFLFTNIRGVGYKPHFKEKNTCAETPLALTFLEGPVVRSPVTVTENSSVVVPTLIWTSCTVIAKSRKTAHLNT